MEQVSLLYSIVYVETIHDLQPHPQRDNYILSTSKDGTMRLWDVDKKKCLAIFEADATVTVSNHSLHPLYGLPLICVFASAFLLQATHLSREHRVVSFASGLSLMAWTSMMSLSACKRNNQSYTKSSMVTTISVRAKKMMIVIPQELNTASCLDCIRYANGHVISKSSNGRIEIWEADTEKVRLDGEC